MRSGLILGLALILGGCSIFGDEEELKPAELVDFTTTADVDKVWSRRVGKKTELAGADLEPAFLDGRIYAASYDGHVLSVDANNGRPHWDVELEERISAGPAVSEDLVVVGTVDGEVIALNVTDGGELWRRGVSSEVLAAPAIHNGMVIVRTQDGRVFALSQDNGQRQWVYDQSVPLLTLRGNSSPVARGGYAYIGFDNGRVAALRVSDGSLVWEQTVAAPEGRTELERIVDVDASLAVVGSDLYAVSYQGRLASLTADSGRLLWVRDFSANSGIAISRAELNVTDADDAVWALDRLSGGTLWRQDRLVRRQVTGPARVGDLVVVGDYEGYLHFLSAETGEFSARVRADSDGLAHAPLVIGQTLYVLGRGGSLSAYRVN